MSDSSAPQSDCPCAAPRTAPASTLTSSSVQPSTTPSIDLSASAATAISVQKTTEQSAQPATPVLSQLPVVACVSLSPPAVVSLKTVAPFTADRFMETVGFVSAAGPLLPDPPEISRLAIIRTTLSQILGFQLPELRHISSIQERKLSREFYYWNWTPRTVSIATALFGYQAPGYGYKITDAKRFDVLNPEVNLSDSFDDLYVGDRSFRNFAYVALASAKTDSQRSFAVSLWERFLATYPFADVISVNGWVRFSASFPSAGKPYSVKNSILPKLPPAYWYDASSMETAMPNILLQRYARNAGAVIFAGADLRSRQDLLDFRVIPLTFGCESKQLAKSLDHSLSVAGLVVGISHQKTASDLYVWSQLLSGGIQTTAGALQRSIASAAFSLAVINKQKSKHSAKATCIRGPADEIFWLNSTPQPLVAPLVLSKKNYGSVKTTVVTGSCL